MSVLVAWKWVQGPSERWAPVSAADHAALEVALRLARSEPVVVAAVGPAGAAGALRTALAVGAADVVRIDAPAGLSSTAVAGALAAVARDIDATWTVCGNASTDRQTGSVPAFLAGSLGWAQAIGLCDIDWSSTGGGDRLRVVRRLDAGRRERLSLTAPAVLSVEPPVATLRRASLPGELAARRNVIPVRPGPAGPVDLPTSISGFRPRARVVAAPLGADALARVRTLVALDQPASPAETVTLGPDDAARRIVAALRAWGYLEADA